MPFYGWNHNFIQVTDWHHLSHLFVHPEGTTHSLNEPNHTTAVWLVTFQSNKKMTVLTKSFIAIFSLASCSFAAADTIYDTVYLSTAYDMSVSGWSQWDQEAVYVPAHSTLIVTDYDLYSDTMQNMVLQQDAAVRFEGSFVNDSNEGKYYYVELESAVYTDYYDLFHAPASSASVSYQIDSND